MSFVRRFVTAMLTQAPPGALGGFRSTHANVDGVFTTDAAKARFRALSERWNELERAGMPASYPEEWKVWVAQRDAWAKGDEDVSMLTALEADANRIARGARLDKGDPSFAFTEAAALKGGSLDQTNTLFEAAEAAKDLPGGAEWKSPVPLPTTPASKAVWLVVALALVALAVRR